jgi:lipopolysaccharide transport system ATP-binding protein
MRSDYRPSAGFYLRTSEGIHLLSSFDFHHPVYGDVQRKPGVYSSVCSFPGNFLAPGFYSITPAINFFFPVSGCSADYPNALSFEIVDNDDPKAVRRYVQTGWPGIIRPMLDWDIRRV